MQENIYIGDTIKIQTWVEDGIRWYPPRTVQREVLNKAKISMIQLKNGGWDKYCKKVKLEYEGQLGGLNLNETTVMREDGFKEYIQNKVVGKMNLEQKRNYNLLLEYLGIDKKVVVGDIKVKYKDIELNKDNYSEYEWDCLQYYINNTDLNNSNSWFKLCTTCQRYFPMTQHYFSPNKNTDDKLTTYCKTCHNTNIIHSNKILNHVYLTMGLDKYIEFKNIMDNNDLIIRFMIDNKIYLKYLDSKEIELKYLGIAIKEGYIYKYSFIDFQSFINSNMSPRDVLKTSLKNNIVDIMDYCDSINAFNLDVSYINYLWKFNRLKVDSFKLTDEQRISNIKTYIKCNDIVIKDIFKYNKYHELFKKAKAMDRRYRASHVELILKLYDNKYPAYMFGGGYNNYWKEKENRIKEMKYFIEEDLKLENLDKLPIYLTKNLLSKKNRTFYGVLSNYYNGELYQWLNECYPNRYIPEDFNIFFKRDEFDSIEEGYVHDVLKEHFGKSLLYNSGDASNRLTIGTYQPDWIVLYEKPIIIEYLGMYTDDKNNATIINYRSKADRKISYYDKLEHYDKIYIYPKDLRTNFKGVYDKLLCYEKHK